MQEPIICEDCGTKVAAGSKSCPNCGLDFEAQEAWEERVEDSVGKAFPLPPEEARHGKVEEAAKRGTSVRPAGFGIRLAAYFVDSILATVLNYALMAVVMVAIMATTGFDEESLPPGLAVAVMLISIAVPLLYFALMESSPMQATLGKKLVGIKVTNLRGQRIGFGRAVGRYLGKIVSAMILLIGFIMVAFTKRNQGLHDMMAGTLVIHN